MQLTVQVSEDVALALNKKGAPNSDAQALLRTIGTFDLELKPMHQNANDSSLQTYFIIEVQDTETAQRLTDHLRQLEAIKAAYVKPPDELA